MRSSQTLGEAIHSGVLHKMIWGAVFEMVDSTSEAIPRLQAQFVATSRVRMRGFGEVREWFSSADAKPAMLVGVFRANWARLQYDLPRGYHE